MKVSVLSNRIMEVSYHPNIFKKTIMNINRGNCGELLKEMPAWRVRQFTGKLAKIPDCELAKKLKAAAEENLETRKKMGGN